MQPGQWDQRLKRSTQCREAPGAFYPDRAPLSLTGYCSTSAPHPAYVPRLPVASSMTGFSMHGIALERRLGSIGVRRIRHLVA